MVIYKTTNLINGKFYIGSDINNNPKYFGSGKLIKLAIAKYGIENFIKEIICECKTIDEIKEREGFWIKELKATTRGIGYNISEGHFGENTWGGLSDEQKANVSDKLSKANLGRKHTDEFKENCRISALNRNDVQVAWNKGLKTGPLSDEHKEKIGKSLRGGTHSDNHRKAVSESRIGMKFSEEHKENIRKSRIGKKLSEETKQKMSDSKKGIPQKKLTCPHCGKEGGTTMYRWHFDKCKNK